MTKEEAIEELTKAAKGFYGGSVGQAAYLNAIEIVKQITEL